MDIRIRAAAVSDGGRRRSSNQDAFGFDLAKGLFIVCDGVGGANAGDVASRMVVSSMLDLFPADPDHSRGGDLLHRCVQRANRHLHDAAQEEKAFAGMCTTVVSAFFDGARFWIAHVGDSRVYLLRQGSLHRLTDDHSVLAGRLRNGLAELPAEEAQRMEGVLTHAMGANDFVVPDITMVAAEDGDFLLLATDGLTKMLPQSEILAVMMASHSPEEACRDLVFAANDAGGEDNITCLIVGID